MDTFIANIDEKNLDLLDKAQQKSGIDYEKGTQMEFGSNNVQKQIFYPIFCESIIDAVILIKEYAAIKAKSNNLGEDLITTSVLTEMLDPKS